MEDSPKEEVFQYYTDVNEAENVEKVDQRNQVIFLTVQSENFVDNSTINDTMENLDAPEISEDIEHNGLSSFGSNVTVITLDDGRILMTPSFEEDNFESIEPHLISDESINKDNESEEEESTQNSNDDDTNLKIVQVVGNSSQMYQMVYCDVGSSTQHTVKKEKSYVCVHDGCGKTYTSAHHLNVHMRNHSGSKPYVCTEERCDKTFSTNYSLKAHIRTHTGEKPYNCVICQKCFKTCGDLQKHVRIHTGEKPFVCPIEGCGRSFTTSNIRKVHVRSHTGERPYSCDYPNCGKAFASSTNYKNHIRIHSGEKPYACNVKDCGKRFTEYSSLYKHNLVHQPDRPYTCIFCGQKFKQDCTMNLHKRVKHNVIVANDGRELVILNSDLDIDD